MKNKFFLVLTCVLLFSIAAKAQWNVVRETDRMMSFGSRPCFRMEFADTDPKIIENSWASEILAEPIRAVEGKAKGDSIVL